MTPVRMMLNRRVPLNNDMLITLSNYSYAIADSLLTKLINNDNTSIADIDEFCWHLQLKFEKNRPQELMRLLTSFLKQRKIRFPKETALVIKSKTYGEVFMNYFIEDINEIWYETKFLLLHQN